MKRPTFTESGNSQHLEKSLSRCLKNKPARSTTKSRHPEATVGVLVHAGAVTESGVSSSGFWPAPEWWYWPHY